MTVYDERDLVKQSPWQRLFGILPKQNYVRELETLLAKNEGNLLSIKQSEVDALNAKYKVKTKDFAVDRRILFDRFFGRCMEDERLTSEEKEQLLYLCHLLNVDEGYMDKCIAERGEWIYRNKVRVVIADNVVTDEEDKELDAIQKEFNLTEGTSTDIYAEECTKKVQDFVDTLISNRRMSPDDEKTLNDMAKGLNATLTYTDNGLTKLRRLWDIENAPLIPISCDINLQKTESLYYKTNIDWYEERTRTSYVSYGGVSCSFRIAKGVTLRSGMIAPSRHSEEYMQLIDSGEVYLTNKRIIFTGEHGNKNITWTKVLAITAYGDGIEIGKDTGRKPFFKCSDVEEMGLFITRLLKDS